MALAKLTLKRDPWRHNVSLRRRALVVARRHLDVVDQALVLNNWFFAALTTGRREDARRLARVLERFVGRHGRKLRSSPETRETIPRYLRNRGRLCFLDAAAHGDVGGIRRGGLWYRRAILAVRGSDHLWVNFQVDWAEQQVAAAAWAGPSALDQAGRRLAAASRALDTHQCNLCEAYYHQVTAALQVGRGQAVFNQSRTEAAAIWRLSLVSARDARRRYAHAGHHYVKEVDETAAKAKELLARAVHPPRIYLAFKEPDKALVAPIGELLERIGLEPWFYEKSMAVHVPPKRAMRSGMEKAAMCVFFVTPEFSDTGGLAYEIDLALRRRSRAKGFVILVLTLAPTTPASAGPKVAVPVRLRRQTRYIPCKDQLQCVREIFTWMPIRIGTPFVTQSDARGSPLH